MQRQISNRNFTKNTSFQFSNVKIFNHKGGRHEYEIKLVETEMLHLNLFLSWQSGPLLQKFQPPPLDCSTNSTT
jgi:hypothetical protein